MYFFFRREEITYIEQEATYLQRNWQWLTVVGGLGGIVMLCALCIGYVNCKFPYLPSFPSL